MNRIKHWIQDFTLIKPQEYRATAAAFLMVFLLMASYFVLRPVRDAMASDWSDSQVSLLWNIQFFLSVGLIALYSYAIGRLRFRLIVPTVYCLFAISFLGFYFFIPVVQNSTLLEQGFYLWVAAFSLFNLSVFWSFMTDMFSAEQGQRLFAVIGSGASAGAIIGPSIPALFSATLGLSSLMLIAASGLFLVLPLIYFLYREKEAALGNSNIAFQTQQERMGGQWWQGFASTVSNPYLLSIAVFMLLYVFIGSFVYFEQKNILAAYSRIERTQILSGIDWIVNSLTFICAFFLTGRLLKKKGMRFTLASVPFVVLFGLLLLALAPVVVVLFVLQIARRVGNYSVTRPAREVLFTKVSTEDRFKAKPVIDVVVYRGGDAVSASLFALLSDGLALSLAVISVIGAGIAALWAYCGLLIGRRYENHQTEHARTPISRSSVLGL